MYQGKKVKVLYNSHTVEVYYEYNRIALHICHGIAKAFNTIPGHMPSNHQHALEAKGWTKEGLLADAAQIGVHTRQAAEHMLSNSIYIEQNYKACHGMLMLHKRYSKLRLEAACARALTGTRVNYTMIKNILKNGLDKQLQFFESAPLPAHENIRGAENYQWKITPHCYSCLLVF